MTGYARKWECPLCGVEVEGVDWPLDGDEPCERCKERGAPPRLRAEVLGQLSVLLDVSSEEDNNA